MTPHEKFLAAFGKKVPAADVPAFVRMGLRVWSFGYGSDLPDDEFTTIQTDDLSAWEEDSPDEIERYLGPFALDMLECRCTGPTGWHCPAEFAEHWAKGDQPDSECGYCGGKPEGIE